jgi:hypothetical protein
MKIKNYKSFLLLIFISIFVIIFLDQKIQFFGFKKIHEADNNSIASISNNLTISNIEIEEDDSHSLGNKKARELSLIAEAIESKKILTENNLYLNLKDKGVNIESDMADRMRRGQMTEKDFEWLQVQIANDLSEEENFSIEMSGVESFKKLKSAYDERSKNTGLYYGNEILNAPVSFRDASSIEIIEVLKSGSVLPRDALLNMIANNRLDLAVELTIAGFPLDANYYDDTTTLGLMEIQVQALSWDPQKTPVDQQLKYIDILKDLGVPLKEQDGTRDALDRALEYSLTTTDADNAERLIILAKKLNSVGIPVEASHKELLANLQIKYPDLYQKYLMQIR